MPDRVVRPRATRWFDFLPYVDDGTLHVSYRRRAESIATALALGRTADAAIAVERYQRANGGVLPETLAQLVPQYFVAVPTDPFSGREIRYAKSSDRWVVYSIGLNGKDDGGSNVDYPVRRSGAFQARSAPPDLGVARQLSSKEEAMIRG